MNSPAPETNENAVLNLSSVELSDTEVSLLSKGLTFCPTPREPNDREIREDTRKFFRRLRVREYWSRKPQNLSSDESDDSDDQTVSPTTFDPFRPPSQWEPNNSKCGALESYIDAVEEDVNKLLDDQNNP